MNLILINLNFLISLDLKFDTDGNEKTDRWIKFEVMKKWEANDLNTNGKADEPWFYINDKNVVHIIKEEDLDFNKDGKLGWEDMGSFIRNPQLIRNLLP